MHKHVVRLLTLIAIVAVIAISAKTFFRDDSFHQYGHYRGDSVAEVASKLPKHQGSASCRSCHKKVYAEWSSGIHYKANKDGAVMGIVVKAGPGCEVCHNGPAGNHPSKEPMPLSVEDQVTTITHLDRKTHPANIPGRNLMREPEDMRILCANCHVKIPGHPLRGKVAGASVPGQGITESSSVPGVPQIVIETHGGTELCTTCHNPHSPRVNFAALPRPPVDPKTGKAVPVSAAKPGDANAGKALVATCAGCHGDAGISGNPAWPNLAGQHARYTADALAAFKSGIRTNDMMGPLAAALSEADMQNIAAYYAKAACKTPGGDKTKAAQGKIKAESAGCAACHNAGGLRGNGPVGISAAQAWPNLAGQNAEYLAAALKSFRDGSRKHAVMTGAAKALNDADIDNLSAYYASVSCK